MSAMLKKINANIALLLIAAVLVVGVALLALLDNTRIDLTEGKLYTLSAGSENIVNDIPADQPVSLHFYYSEALMAEIPVLRNYSRRIQEILREYQRAAGDKLIIEQINVEEFSEAEDLAAASGLKPMPNGNGQQIYLGLVAEQGDKRANVPFFNPQKENLLEYEISQAIASVAVKKQIKVGIINGVPMFRSMDYKTNRPRPSWLIAQHLENHFDFKRYIGLEVEKIDDDISVLLVAHPRMLSDQTQFAIDQFVMRGGKLLVFVDPHAETDDSEADLAENGGFLEKSSSLDRLFDVWGVEFDPTKVVLDLDNAHSIPVDQYGREVPHVGILGLMDESINRDSPIVANLQGVNVGSIGYIAPKAGATTEFVPLLVSGLRSDLMDREQYALVANHGQLLQGMKHLNQQFTYAAMVSGPVKSAFPDGKPATSNYTGEVLTEAKAPLNMIVVADTDILTDRMWVERQDFFGETNLVPFAANGDMVINMLDSLGGSADLISLRSRVTYQRPFTRVDALEKAASDRWRAEEEKLTQSLKETQAKLDALQQPAEGSEEIGLDKMLADAKQQAELAAFQKQRMELRRNLRDVQRQLKTDVERLGQQLKIINIGLVPALITVIALIVGALRLRRRRRTD